MQLANPFALFIALVIGHALGDYPLQGDFLARAKNHKAPIPGVPWYQALTAHALIQAGIVWVITGSAICALLEFMAHWCIDRMKCEGAIDFDVDQFLHVLCKAVYVGILVAAHAS
jgi:hypothetical protein